MFIYFNHNPCSVYSERNHTYRFSYQFGSLIFSEPPEKFSEIIFFSILLFTSMVIIKEHVYTKPPTSERYTSDPNSIIKFFRISFHIPNARISHRIRSAISSAKFSVFFLFLFPQKIFIKCPHDDHKYIHRNKKKSEREFYIFLINFRPINVKY